MARSDVPWLPLVNAIANGIRMNPPWLTLEYASMRTMFFCLRATTLPTVIVSAAITHRNGRYTSCACGKATNTIRIRPTKPAAFEATLRKAVIGVGAPSYVSGAQLWNGTALTLKAKPMITNTTPTTSMPTCLPPIVMALPMSVSIVLPTVPYSRLMP